MKPPKLNVLQNISFLEMYDHLRKKSENFGRYENIEKKMGKLRNNLAKSMTSAVLLILENKTKYVQ